MAAVDLQTAAPSSALTGVIIGLASSFGSIILIFLIVFLFWASGCAGSGRIILDRIGRPGEFDDEQAFAREEAEALEAMSDMARTEYLRAKAYIAANPPESAQTDISLSQFMAITEKGVSAWEFEPELEIANCFVEARTEIEFFDSECTVMSNLPVPKTNDVYYWEAKVYDKPENTLLGIGMATKPYPLFRLPGYHKYSVAYHSNGSRHYNQPFTRTPYGPQIVQGDVIGVGYRPRTGVIFFTRNGKKLDEVVSGLKSQNFFPAIGATGPASVHVNFGQSGFVFIEANVKKWGLAPVNGSLAPPPPYGSEQGSILLETGSKDGFVPSQSRAAPHHQHHPSQGRSDSRGTYAVRPNEGFLSAAQPQHGRSRSGGGGGGGGGNFRIATPTSPGPVRSPTDISLAQLVPNEENGEASGSSAQTSRQQQQQLQQQQQEQPQDSQQRPHQQHQQHQHQQHQQQHQQQQQQQQLQHRQPHRPPYHYQHQPSQLRHQQHFEDSPLQLRLEDATNPPPDYTSPVQSDSEQPPPHRDAHPHPQRYSIDSDEETPLIQVMSRSRGGSLATAGASPGSQRGRHGSSASAMRPPIPSYSDAVRQSAAPQRERRDSGSEGSRGHSSDSD